MIYRKFPSVLTISASSTPLTCVFVLPKLCETAEAAPLSASSETASIAVPSADSTAAAKVTDLL